MRRFYEFRQNNSFGRWVGERYLFVEAVSPEQANALAQQWGVYFGGVQSGLDCPCCGDRWYPVDEYDQTYNMAEAVMEMKRRNVSPEDYAIIVKTGE